MYSNIGGNIHIVTNSMAVVNKIYLKEKEQ